ncbi:nucleoside phosphorylase domain-containing protein [Ilyonectria destructans]|nr:nucleoside phosphorylase domain-containing protein [Ilyonectria destructans]
MSSSMDKRPVTRDQFEIALICALALEADAVYLLFDEFFPNEYYKAAGDLNHYTNGRIGNYNVVLVLLPGVGKVHAASAAASLNASYTNLRLAIVVGVCGGVPGPYKDEDEILLGDVVISNALIQFDFGRRCPGGLFLRKSSVQENLGRLNKYLRSLLRSLETSRYQADLELRTAQLLQDLQVAHSKCVRKRRRRRDKYKYPGTFHDVLFEASYRHRHRGLNVSCCSETDTCEAAFKASCQECGCDKVHMISRSEQLNFKRELEENDPIKAQDPTIHIGPVASGDTVIKSGEDRDRITKEEGVIAFEMEGAGIWDEMTCIVIKGVCDYADSHKHKQWQDFAAATAAAAMKALLEVIVDIQKPHNGAIDPRVRSSAASPHDPRLALMFLTLQGRGNLCAQIPLSLIMVIDARGRNLPFHLETISSKELFIQVLKSRFVDLGTKKIDRGEWFLEDQSNGQRLDLSKPWQSIIKPYQVLKMSMVFRRRNKSCTECPSCGFMNPGLSTEEIQCHVCELTYRRVEEVQSIQIDLEPNREAKSSASAHPLGPKRPSRPSPEDEIGRYKHVELVDVDFKIDRTSKGKQLINTALLLSCQDLRDAEHLAEELASIYGISEQDSLILANMVIKVDTDSALKSLDYWIQFDDDEADRVGSFEIDFSKRYNMTNQP